MTICVLGIILWKQKGSPVLLYLVPGIISHVLLDAMWNIPINWFYPALGPFVQRYSPDYFCNMFFVEISSFSEWLFFIILSVCLFSEFIFNGQSGSMSDSGYDSGHSRWYRFFRMAVHSRYLGSHLLPVVQVFFTGGGLWVGKERNPGERVWEIRWNRGE